MQTASVVHQQASQLGSNIQAQPHCRMIQWTIEVSKLEWRWPSGAAFVLSTFAKAVKCTFQPGHCLGILLLPKWISGIGGICHLANKADQKWSFWRIPLLSFHTSGAVHQRTLWSLMIQCSGIKTRKFLRTWKIFFVALRRGFPNTSQGC